MRVVSGTVLNEDSEPGEVVGWDGDYLKIRWPGRPICLEWPGNVILTGDVEFGEV